MVRSRAKVPAKNSITYEDLRYERRIELAYEGQYWYDLLRRSYYQEEEVIGYLNSQERNAGYEWDENEICQYAKTGDGTGVSTATKQHLAFPVSNVDLTRNPKLKDEPVETTESGLSLNWANEAGNGHFYWGYYCGMDYAVKAFEYAAKYNPNGAKLFVNDYNLESNPNKLAKLIEFVEYIDNNGAHVDGIGTQLHVSSSISKEQVDAMFKTLAATGKLVRITELDITVGTMTPSADQLQKQADCYQMILTSYFENIPENQQSAITLWTLSDNEKEHEYWLKDDAPNIFDASYGRKLAYKGVCDAIAGKDVSADFRSHDYSKK